MGLMVGALSSCNGLTGIYDLSPGEGLGGSGDDALAAGGKPRAVGGSVASGGRKSASGGSVESSGGERSSGGAREGSGGTREGAGGAREGGGGAESVGGAGGELVGEVPLLDDFSAPLDDRWKNPFGFRIEDGALVCDECMSAILWNETFSLPQAAQVQLSSIPSEVQEMNLVLVARSATCDLIEITYNMHGHVGVSSCQGGGWQTHGGVYRTVGEGGTLGGRVFAGDPGEVVVQVVVNGVGAYETAVPFPFVSGSMGVSGKCTANCVGPLKFDNFRGGELAE